MGFVYVAVTLGLGVLLYWGPYALPSLDALSYSNYLYAAILLAHLVCGLLLIGVPSRARKTGSNPAGLYRVPEVLFVLSLLLYLFAYIYALNANMDYIQRFMASGGAVRLALDTRQERLAASVKFGPLLLVNAFFYLFWRIRRVSGFASVLSRWALPIVLLSVLLAVVSFPSFFSLEGLGYVAFVALVPLLLVFRANSLGWGVFYGLTYGLLQTMLLNFWLGTYSLVTLQLVTLVFLLFYVLFSYSHPLAVQESPAYRLPDSAHGLDRLRVSSLGRLPGISLGLLGYHSVSVHHPRSDCHPHRSVGCKLHRRLDELRICRRTGEHCDPPWNRSRGRSAGISGFERTFRSADHLVPVRPLFGFRYDQPG